MKGNGMAKAWIMGAALLALAGCNDGMRHADTPYGRYLAEREVALTGKGPVPRVVPVTLPVEAPRPDQIAPQPAVAPVAAAAPATRPRPAVRPATGYDSTASVLARYATTLNHDPGEARFARNGGAPDTSRACARFATSEAAQIAFIARGGPQADPLGLDPDGDGFVCGWDPRPLREAGL